MHGYRPGRLVSVMFSDLLTPEHLCDYQEFRRLLALHGRVRLDSESRRQDGSTMDIEVRGSRFSYGNKPHVLAIITDVSERRNAEKRQALLARKALVAQEEERARISRDLHDELGQLLTALRFELDLLHKRIVRSPQDIGDSFIHAAQLVEKAAEELRRICKGLRPPLLDDLGMEPAVRLLVDEFKERTGITVEMEIQFEESQLEVPQEVALCVYRILQESLTNISRHAAARHVNIMLYWRESEFILSVSDDGQGFEINDPSTWKGSGLAGMRERARLVNGSVKIISGNMQGTGIELRVPLSSINVPSSSIKPVSLGTNANSLPEPRL
jgi:signal transduction histidine kinase